VSKPQYGHAHRKRRDALLPRAYGQPCPLCGVVMLPGMALALDHSVPIAYDPRSQGDRIVHRSCNSRAGQRIGARRRRKGPSDMGTSGSW
jgi:5-methylcytosine-specific restriction endonuclease McrA